jgi:hypothetical protein
VQANGKVCIAPGQALYVIGRPGDIVRESLARAKSVLERGLTGDNTAELHREYVAYWAQDAPEAALSVFELGRSSRELRVISTRGWFGGQPRRLVAESVEEAKRWATRVGVDVASEAEIDVWVFELDHAFPLDVALASPRAGSVLDWIRGKCEQ